MPNRNDIKEKLIRLWYEVNGIRIDMTHDDHNDWQTEEGVLCEIEQMLDEITA